MLGGETQNTHLLVTAVPKCKEAGPPSRGLTGALGLTVSCCVIATLCLSLAPGHFTSLGVPRQMPPRFLAVLGGCEILFQEIGLQWGDPDPSLTSRSYCGPSCLDEKLEEAHRGVMLGPRRTGSLKGLARNPLLSPGPCNRTPGGNQTLCPQDKNTICSCCDWT